MKVVRPVIEVIRLTLQNLTPCREITNVLLKLVVLALKGLAPCVQVLLLLLCVRQPASSEQKTTPSSAQVAHGVGERRLLTVHLLQTLRGVM